MKFVLGQIVATPAAIEHLALHNLTPLHLLARHARCDWGDLCKDDKRLNDLAVANQDGRILSMYVVGSEKMCVITEADPPMATESKAELEKLEKEIAAVGAMGKGNGPGIVAQRKKQLKILNKKKERLLSQVAENSHYVVGSEKLYVITEADRSSTCVLLSKEY